MMQLGTVIIMVFGLLFTFIFFAFAISAPDPYNFVSIIIVFSYLTFAFLAANAMFRHLLSKLSTYRRREHEFYCFALISLIFIGLSCISHRYDISVQEMVNASPFTPEWGNTPSTGYGFPVNVYLLFDTETGCCGSATFFPSAAMFNIFLLAISHKVLTTFVAFAKLLFYKAASCHAR